MTAPAPESIRLARAAWDAATPGTRVLMFLRCKRAMLEKLSGDELDQVPFCNWDALTPETCQALAWDVQFLRRYLGAGRDALKAAEGRSGASVTPLRASA